MTPDGPILALSDLAAGYGPVEVLKGVSIEVRRGEIVTVLGCNGAGKSTLMKAAAGVIPLVGGTMRLAGESYAGEPAHRILARGLCLVPEGRRIFPRLSVRENLAVGAFLRRGREVAKRLDEMLDLFPILRERAEQAGGTLSGGEQQMLAIARGLMSEPEVLLLDEPSLGLAPLFVRKVAETLAGIRKRGVTVLLVEQNAALALDLADRAYVLETGRVTLSGTGRALKDDPRVKEAYLGG